MEVTGLVERSFYGGVLILVILAVRAMLLGRLPKRTFSILWGVVLVRLLLPLSFSSAFSVYTFLQPDQKMVVSEDISHGMIDGIATDSPMALTETQNLSPGKPAYSGSDPKSIPILSIVWGTGAVGCGLFFILVYLHNLQNFRNAVPIKDSEIRQWLDSRRSGKFISVRQSAHISAPLTYGVLRPVILLPEQLTCGDRQELEYMLQHEYVHICHHDTAMKLAMVCTLCIHWFNPLVWLMAALLNRDIELACDEGVLRQFGEQSKAGYAMTLIGMEENKRSLLPLYNGFSKNPTEERIQLIMKYKKATYVTGIAALFLVLSVVLVFATSAKPEKATEDPETSSANLAEPDQTDVPMDPPPDATMEELQKVLIDELEDLIDIPMDPPPKNTNTDTDIPDMESMTLYSGNSYSILIPSEGWKLYAPDAWMCEANEQVQVWVNDYSQNTWEQTKSSLKENGYHQTSKSDLWVKESDGRIFFAKIYMSDFSIMCVNYTYPEDGKSLEIYESLLHTIALSFTMLSDVDEENLSEDEKELKSTVLAFWGAYLAGNTEAMKQYLVKDFSWEMEVFPDGIDGHVAEETVLYVVKGLDMEDKAAGEPLEVWLEFRPAAGADYLESLTLKVTKEPDGWKILSYGLEL